MNLESLKKEVESVKPEEIPAALALLASIQVSLASRLMSSSSPVLPSEDRILDAEQAAVVLNVKKSKVYELARQTVGAPPFFHLGKYPRISESALRKWISEQR